MPTSSRGLQQAVCTTTTHSDPPTPKMQLSSWLIFRVCLTAHTASALWNIVHDCDETFNYWEPLHWLLHGSGFQTWEYAPQYALRSYLYLGLYAPPAALIGWLGGARVTQFYGVRLWMAFWTAAAETAAFAAVKRRLDPAGKASGSVHSVAFATFSAFSAGVFAASTALLPSAFAMQVAYAYLAAWLSGRYFLAVMAVACMAIVGWPFAAALGFPLAVELAFLRRQPLRLAAYSLASGLAFAVPVAVADTLAYGRPTVSPLNLLRYNVLNSGSHLYGTAPASYYAVNYALNFSPVLPVLLVAGLVASWLCAPASSPKQQQQLVLWLSPLVLWNVVFFAQAHKEERFLYPCYPFLCLAAAVALERLRRCLGNWLVPCVLAAFVALSASRVAAVLLSYQSHVTIYHRLSLHGPPGRLCLGKEWHRFPSAFLLPNNWTVGFIRSDFAGQLPGRFGVEGQEFNLDNREELSRYLDPLKDCDYLIDRRSASVTEREPDYCPASQQSDSHIVGRKSWQLLEDLPFLEPARSPRLWRAFYVPWLFERRVAFTSYLLLRRTK